MSSVCAAALLGMAFTRRCEARQVPPLNSISSFPRTREPSDFLADSAGHGGPCVALMGSCCFGSSSDSRLLRVSAPAAVGRVRLLRKGFDLRPPPFRQGEGEGWGGVGAFPGKPQKQEQKHPTPALPFACGEREGAEHLLDAFELEEVLTHPSQGLDLGGRAESGPGMACGGEYARRADRDKEPRPPRSRRLAEVRSPTHAGEAPSISGDFCMKAPPCAVAPASTVPRSQPP